VGESDIGTNERERRGYELGGPSVCGKLTHSVERIHIDRGLRKQSLTTGSPATATFAKLSKTKAQGGKQKSKKKGSFNANRTNEWSSKFGRKREARQRSGIGGLGEGAGVGRASNSEHKRRVHKPKAPFSKGPTQGTNGKGGRKKISNRKTERKKVLISNPKLGGTKAIGATGLGRRGRAGRTIRAKDP